MAQEYYSYRGKLRKVVRVDEKHNWPHTMLEIEYARADGNTSYPLVRKTKSTVEHGEPMYVIVWDNCHASGTLPGRYPTEREAARAARAWKREMVAIETTPADRREARDAYQWDVVPEEDSDA